MIFKQKSCFVDLWLETPHPPIPAVHIAFWHDSKHRIQPFIFYKKKTIKIIPLSFGSAFLVFCKCCFCLFIRIYRITKYTQTNRLREAGKPSTVPLAYIDQLATAYGRTIGNRGRGVENFKCMHEFFVQSKLPAWFFYDIDSMRVFLKYFFGIIIGMQRHYFQIP